ASVCSPSCGWMTPHFLACGTRALLTKKEKKTQTLMKPTVTKTLVASAVALLISGCGGSGSDAADPGPVQGDDPKPGLQVSGTAATGLAMAGSTVDVKCVAGT